MQMQDLLDDRMVIHIIDAFSYAKCLPAVGSEEDECFGRQQVHKERHIMSIVTQYRMS